MIVWGCLNRFLAISIFFDFFTPMHSRLPQQIILEVAKIIKKTSKIMIFASKWPKQLQKNTKITHLQCSDHPESCWNRFSCVFWSKKHPPLENEIFVIFGHTERKSMIWNFDHQNRPPNPAFLKNRKNRKIHFSRPILGRFWRMGTQKLHNEISDHFQLTRRLKTFSLIFYGQNMIFSLFSMKNHWFSNHQNGVSGWKKSRKSKNRFLSIFLP